MDVSTTAMVTILGLPAVHQGSKVAARVAEDFLKRILAPTADAAGKALAQPIEEWHNRRVKRARGIIADAAALLGEAKLRPHPVPGRLLWPILEKASLEDESLELQAKWTALLANAAVEGASRVHPAYPQILAELSPLDCLVLDELYVSSVVDDDWNVATWTALVVDDLALNLGVDIRQVMVSTANLARLNLVGRPKFKPRSERDINMADVIGGPADYMGNYYLTDFGFAFIKACIAPTNDREELPPTIGNDLS